ncbi:transglycosylase family protein [Streptomyces sp. NPDC048638]|uniref:transglycosylase family protein n=1 Tax=Streptomyces sp. NPDC048638 TaxID=3365580 RepID=UPI00371B32CE
MRSGNGRHRRPRQAPAIFVTAGVTGAGLALPLFAASGAHAADTATWDRVAQCESGGMWSSASGNGFYGGLQLTQEMWDQYGGSSYASRPDLASRSQQIAVAESILADRGPDAWPSCAVNAGLTEDGRAPEVDPGSTSTPRPDPSDSGGPSGPSGTGPSGDATPSPSGDATPSPDAPDSADPSDSAGPDGDGGSADDSTDPAPDRAPTQDHAKGKHRGDAEADKGDGGGKDAEDGKGSKGDEGAGDAAGEGRPSGRHASRGGDAPRTDPSDAAGDYTVRPGDTLSGIAEAHDLPGGWPALYDRNEKEVGADADLIHPGQLLDLGHSAG